MLLEADHSTGMEVSVELPFPLGPRHCGQFSANTKEGTKTTMLKAIVVLKVAGMLTTDAGFSC
jgi:hypothetical protein